MDQPDSKTARVDKLDREIEVLAYRLAELERERLELTGETEEELTHSPPPDNTGRWLDRREYTTSRRVIDQEIRNYSKRIRKLYELVSLALPLRRQLDEMLRVGCEILMLDIGMLSEISNDQYVIRNIRADEELGLTSGDKVSFEDTFCRLTLEAGGPFSIDHASQSHYREEPAHKKFNLESYIGVPVYKNEELFGTIGFSSKTPRPVPFRATDIDLIQLMGRWVGFALEREESQREILKARDAADAANRAKTEFVASVSHEIRTPMNAIIGMADLLGDTELSAEQRKYVGILHKAGESLLALINDILDLSKIEAGRLELDETDFDLEELLDRTCEIMAFSAHQKNLDFACRLMPGTPRVLRGDPNRLRQVLMNLIGNAIKFTENGQVTVEVTDHGRDDMAGYEPGRRLEFAVRDTGIGIPREKWEEIFGYFTQVDSSTTRHYGGTGLGLAISRELVNMMIGQLGVRGPDEGQGSIFYFTARFANARGPAGEKETKPTFAPGLRVLIVDDYEINRLIIRDALEPYQLEVSEASTAAEALEQLKQACDNQAPFHLVILDADLPAGNVQSPAHFVRTDTRMAASCIIYMTTASRHESRKIKFRAGLEAGITRPIQRREILRTMVTLMGNVRRGSGVTTPNPDSSGARTLRILLAEDSDDNRLLIQAYLKKTPHKVEIAVNGAQAVKKFQEGEFDLILMDIQMPVMDGYEAAGRVREYEQERGGDIPPVVIIALTAHALKEDVEKSRAAGCNAHMSKPIKKDRFLEMIQGIARGEAPE